MTKKEVYSLIENHYRENYERKVNTVRRFFTNHSDAEDAIQDAYLRALKYWNTYDAAKGNLDAWIAGIIHVSSRETISFYRSQGFTFVPKRDKKNIKAIDLEKLAMEAAMDYELLLRDIRKLIENEKEEHQFILFCFYVEQMTMDDILDVTPLKQSQAYQVVRDFRPTLDNYLRIST